VAWGRYFNVSKDPAKAGKTALGSDLCPGHLKIVPTARMIGEADRGKSSHDPLSLIHPAHFLAACPKTVNSATPGVIPWGAEMITSLARVAPVGVHSR
jgi:hypothetical protein